MKKIFRMANAELNKIFMRPSMFVLATVLVIALVLSFMLFEPSTNSTKFGYELNSTSAIYLQFDNDHKDLEAELVKAKTDIDVFLAEENDTLLQVKTKMQVVKDRFYNHLYLTVLELPKNAEYPSTTNLAKIKDEFRIFKTYVKELKDFLLTKVDGQHVNFFIKTEDYKNLYNTIKNLNETIPSDSQIDEYTTVAVIERLNLIDESFNLNDLNVQVSNLEKIEIDGEQLKELLDLYYYPNIAETQSDQVTIFTHTGKLAEYYNKIEEYYNQNPNTSEEAVMDELNNKIAQYYDYIQINKTLIQNNFELLRIGTKTDDEIVNYNGFSGVSIYNLKHDITVGDYFLKNNTFGYEYLNSFNFNVNSGTETNAYDFAFYAMQILSSLIIIFVIFFASSSIVGEQNTGTLKMTAIRPYTRNKIYSGKFLATFNVALILLLISLAASIAVGIATFGMTTQNVLVVMNASEVFILNPAVLMGIYLLSILVDILFYIALAILISMLIKQTTINTALTSGIFIASTVISGTATASWIRFLPTTHLGLFKYFTTSNTSIFSFSIVPGVNFITSALIIVISIFAFDLIGRLLFTHKSIDK